MKITKELYTKIKYEVDRFPVDQVAVSNGISKRTAKNISNTNNYTEYRKKYCTKKVASDPAPVSTYNNDEVIEILCAYRELMEDDVKLINKLIFINLIISVIGLSTIIAMIAW